MRIAQNNTKVKSMIRVNIILVIIIVFFEFIFDWDTHEALQPSGALPDLDLMVMQQDDHFMTKTDRSAHAVDDIIKSPIFVEGRLGFADEAVSETIILIDGMHTPVELVGTIGSGQDSAAAFSLGNEEIMWLGQNEQLGDWQIDEIKQQGVRLSKLDETLVLQQRKGTDSKTSRDPGEAQALLADKTPAN